MKIISVVLLVISYVGILFSLFMLRRNQQVHRYQLKLLDEVSTCARLDIASGKPWEWRYEEFSKVPYEKMLNKFWKPLDSFYEDKAFITAGSKPTK